MRLPLLFGMGSAVIDDAPHALRDEVDPLLRDGGRSESGLATPAATVWPVEINCAYASKSSGMGLILSVPRSTSL